MWSATSSRRLECRQKHTPGSRTMDFLKKIFSGGGSEFNPEQALAVVNKPVDFLPPLGPPVATNPKVYFDIKCAQPVS
jgi:hypothetical protein